jgi:hypothetical protein
MARVTIVPTMAAVRGVRCVPEVRIRGGLVLNVLGVDIVSGVVHRVRVVIVIVRVVRQVASLRSGLEQAVDGGARFQDLRLAVSARGLRAFGHAVAEVVLKETHCHLLQRAVRGGDLGEDVDAIDILCDHTLQPTHLALNPTEASQDLDLVLLITIHVNGLSSNQPYPRRVSKKERGKTGFRWVAPYAALADAAFMRTQHPTLRSLIFLLAAVLAAPQFLAWPIWAQGTERIVNYDVQIAVESTGSILVTEVIDYDFGGAERHGIFRTIPVRFRYDDRYDRVHRVEVLSVKGSVNTPDQFEEEREGDELRIRIGDPDRTITGRHTYAIVYRVEGALNRFPDHNELYWNAIGTDWDVPIDNATVRVTTLGITEVACFAGPFESSLPCESSSAEEPTATFTDTGLSSYEGLTVVVGFRRGLIPDPRPILEERWSFPRAFSVNRLTVGLASGCHRRRRAPSLGYRA